MYTCAPVCMCACMYCMCVVTKHQLYHVYLCLPWKPLGLQWTRQYLNTLWFDSPALLPTCRSHSTRSWHANCTDSRKHPASLESDTSLQHRSKSIQQNDLHELQFHFITSSWKQGCMQEALHGLAHSLLGSKCRRAWNNLVESRAQYPRNCAAIGIFFRFFGILSCWFLDALSESFATRKRNLKVPEAGFAGQARIPGTSPQNLWPTTSAVLLIYLITRVFTPYEGTEWLDKINLHGQSDHIPFTRMPKRKVLKARVRLSSGTVHSVEIRDTDFAWSTFKSKWQSSHQLGCW